MVAVSGSLAPFNDAPPFTLKSCQSTCPLKYSCAVSTFSPEAIRAPTEKPYSIRSEDQEGFAPRGSLIKVSYQSSHATAAACTFGSSTATIPISAGHVALAGGAGR